jgi:hypothetical protein
LQHHRTPEPGALATLHKPGAGRCGRCLEQDASGGGEIMRKTEFFYMYEERTIGRWDVTDEYYENAQIYRKGQSAIQSREEVTWWTDPRIKDRKKLPILNRRETGNRARCCKSYRSPTGVRIRGNNHEVSDCGSRDGG